MLDCVSVNPLSSGFSLVWFAFFCHMHNAEKAEPPSISEGGRAPERWSKGEILECTSKSEAPERRSKGETFARRSEGEASERKLRGRSSRA
jgi:hypothetical protein